MKNIIESFISIQGEGLRTGRPTLFIRLSGCNLRCVFRNSAGKVTSCCDTPYASFEGSLAEGKYTDDDVIKMLTNNPQVKDVVITGGEPLLNQTSLAQFIKKLREVRDFTLTIETNGTIVPSEYLLEQVDLWSTSPKLASSTPTVKDGKKYGVTEAQCKYHNMHRINIIALATMLSEGHDCQLKFVYTGSECIEEINEISSEITDYQTNHNMDVVNVNDYIMLMPEGITSKAIIGKSDEVVNVCIEHGWTYTSRMHILIWGNVKEK